MTHIHAPRLSRTAITAVVSAALFGSAIIAPATAFAAPVTNNAAVAATADNAVASPLIYNDPTGPSKAASTQVNSGTVTFTHGTRLKATNASGTATTNFSGTNSSAIINPDGLTSLSQVSTWANESDSAITNLNQVIILPYDQNPTAPRANFSADTGLVLDLPTGITLTYSVGGGKYLSWADYKAAGHTPVELKAVQVMGTLAGNTSVSVSIPLTLPTADSTLSFNYADYSYTGEADGKDTEATARFAKALTNEDGSSLIPYRGAYLATVQSTNESGEPVYTTLPTVQQYMPDAVNGTNYWVNNFRDPTLGGNTDDVLYQGGFYIISTAPIAEALKNHGYGVELNSSGDPVTQYLYQAVGDLNLVNPDGTPVKDDPNRTAPYVGVRPVVTGNDVTLDANETFDVLTNEALGLKVYGHDGKTLADLNAAVASGDVTVSGTVDTSKPGDYPITVTYVPDGISNTFTVTVKGADTGTTTPTAEPSGSDSATAGSGAGTGAQVKTSGTGSANDLAGIGVALAAAGAGAAAVARKLRRRH